jgi:hypothetical protein
MLPHDEHVGAYERPSGTIYDRPADSFRRNLSTFFSDRVLWAVAGVIVLFFLFLLSGGLYTITPPNGPVDTAYVMNRVTGKVWMVKTFTKQVGQVRVLAARVAEVEKTKDLAEDTANASIAMNDQVDRTTTDRFDRDASRPVRRR